MVFCIIAHRFSLRFIVHIRFNYLSKKIKTFVMSGGNFLLTPLPPCPSKTPNRIDLGEFGRKQSITNDAEYRLHYYLPLLGDMWD